MIFGSYEEILEEFVVEQLSQNAIYQNNRIGLPIDVLGGHFPATRAQMGDELFAPLAYVYAQYAEDSGWDINLYGQDFPQLLSNQVKGKKATALDWQGIAWLAGLEYALLQLYYDDDTPDEEVTIRIPVECIGDQNGVLGRSKVMSYLQTILDHNPWLSYTATPEDQWLAGQVFLQVTRTLSAEGFAADIRFVFGDTVSRATVSRAKELDKKPVEVIR